MVYVPGLAAGRFPTLRQWERVKAPLLENDEPTDAAHDEEETCLFYVAITRARDELVLSRPEHIGRRSARPSPFLAPIEQRLGRDLLRLEWPTVRASEQTTEREADDGHISNAAAQATQANGEALSVSAIETYARCPRQYAYRYVEELGATTAISHACAVAFSKRCGCSTASRRRSRPNGAGGVTAADSGARAQPLRRVWGSLLHPHRNACASPDDNAARNGHFTMRIAVTGAALSSAHGMRSRATVIATSRRDDRPNRWNLRRRMAIPIGKRTIALTVDRVERPAERQPYNNDSRRLTLYVTDWEPRQSARICGRCSIHWRLSNRRPQARRLRSASAIWRPASANQ